MKIEVLIETWEARKVVVIESTDIPHCFYLLPLRAADQGVSMLNDGRPVNYTIRVIEG